MAPPLIEAIDVRRVLGGAGGGLATEVLRGINLAVHPGEFVAMVGPSGSGKSTLLYLLGLLDRPTTGAVRFEGKSLEDRSELELARLRNQKIGFIYQFHFLLPEFTAVENAMIPMLAHGAANMKAARRRGLELLERLDLAEHADQRPNQLSGGQQQRVAIARALANRPAAILGDEPTGNLDTKNSRLIFELFARINRELGQTIIVVTHDLELAAQAKRVVKIRDGLIESDQPAPANHGP